MRHLRPLFTLPLLSIVAIGSAQTKQILGKVGEVTTDSAVYATPSRESRVIRKLLTTERIVVRQSDRRNWDLVVLKSGHFGYTPSADLKELSITAYRVIHSRSGNSLASRGGAIVREDSGSPVVDYALKFEGTPYEWGGNDLTSGIDCSGFVKKVMENTINFNLPRTAHEQALVGMEIHRLEELQPGDRLYFKMSYESQISHTGIYIGNGNFVHASHGKGGVTTDSLFKPGWRKMLVAARR